MYFQRLTSSKQSQAFISLSYFSVSNTQINSLLSLEVTCFQQISFAYHYSSKSNSI